MPVHIFDNVTDWLVVSGNVKEEEKAIYVYGLQQGLLIIANILTTLVIGFIFSMVWQSLIFMIAYLPLRSFAGGYHAKTQLRCYLFSIMLTIMVLLAIKIIPWTIYVFLWLIMVAGAIIVILAPVEDSNKPLDKKEIAEYKKRTRIILLFECFISVLFLVLGYEAISFCIAISFFALSFMIIIGKLKLHYENKSKVSSL